MQNESEKQEQTNKSCPQSIFVAMDLVNALSSAFTDTATFSKTWMFSNRFITAKLYLTTFGVNK